MQNRKRRNKKIIHLIESSIIDFCKIFSTNYFSRDEAIMVQYKDEDLFYIYPEFHDDHFDISIICMVYQNLSLSETTKVEEIYKSEEFVEYMKETEENIWFLEDSRLVIGFMNSSDYRDLAILKSKLLLNMYIDVESAKNLRNKIDDLLEKQEQASIN